MSILNIVHPWLLPAAATTRASLTDRIDGSPVSDAAPVVAALVGEHGPDAVDAERRTFLTGALCNGDLSVDAPLRHHFASQRRTSGMAITSMLRRGALDDTA